jgi:hypothetical protein
MQPQIEGQAIVTDGAFHPQERADAKLRRSQLYEQYRTITGAVRPHLGPAVVVGYYQT